MLFGEGIRFRMSSQDRCLGGLYSVFTLQFREMVIKLFVLNLLRIVLEAGNNDIYVCAEKVFFFILVAFQFVNNLQILMIIHFDITDVEK